MDDGWMMDGWMDRWMDRWMNEWRYNIDRWMDGWMDEWINSARDVRPSARTQIAEAMVLAAYRL